MSWRIFWLIVVAAVLCAPFWLWHCLIEAIRRAFGLPSLEESVDA